MTALTPDDIFVIGLALDDWLEQNPPDDDPDSRARYEHTAALRERLGQNA